MRVVFPIVLLLAIVASLNAFQNFRKCASWKRVEPQRLPSALHLDSSKRVLSQFLKVVEKNVGSKAVYLTEKSKDQFLDAALRLAKNDQKAQRAILDYAVQQYSSNPVNSAVVRALLIAVPLSLASGVVLHSWWRSLVEYLSERYEIVWLDEDQEQQQEEGADQTISLNPRLLPSTSKVAPTAVQSSGDSAANSGKTSNRWFSRLGSWFGSNHSSVSESVVSDDSVDTTAAAAPSRRIYSEEEYEVEVSRLLGEVRDRLRRSEGEGHFSEEECSAVVDRLRAILMSEVSETERDLALDRYSSVVQYSQYWREFLDREKVMVPRTEGADVSGVRVMGAINTSEDHAVDSSADSSSGYFPSDSLSPM